MKARHVAAAALTLAGGYLAVLAPFYSAIDARAKRVEQKQGDLAWMRGVAGDVIALSRDAPVVVAPSDLRGKPLGRGLRARGRVLRAPAERAAAARSITARYGPAGWIWSSTRRFSVSSK